MWNNDGSTVRGLALAAVVAAGTLVACGGGGGDGGTPAGGQGTLRVALTDAPSCYEHVYVTVEKVRVHTSASAGDGESGWQELVLAAPRRIDLLTLTNGVLEELGSMPLPAGRYSQVRLVLAENGGSAPLANAVQPRGGQLVALRTPSAQQSGLKLQAHFDVVANQIADLVLDFDACKSVVRAGNSGNYNLKPVVSVTPRFTTSVQGFVTSTLALSATSVSAQQNGVVVRSTTPDASGRFVLAFLPGGTYDIVLTSEGHATGVITSVPVATATGVTSVAGTSTAIVLPVSAMNTVSGSFTTTGVVGTSTVSVAVTDGVATAMQDLTGGPKVQVASQPVDAELGTYALRLPAAAPVKAAYSAGGLTFSADTAVAGKYRIVATVPSRTTQEKPADVSTGNAVVNFGFAP
jgi:hypothetical protein